MELPKCVPALARIRGCLFGGLLGDCLGHPFEVDQPPDRKVFVERVHSFVSDFAQGKQASDGVKVYTDDTALARALLRSLMGNRGFNARAVAQSLTETYFAEPNRGYGRRIGQVFEKLRAIGYEDPFAPAREQFDGQGSHGNGGAMRVLAVPIYYATSYSDTLKVAVDQCRITHTHPDAVMGSLLTAASIYFALHMPTSAFLQRGFVNCVLSALKSQFHVVYPGTTSSVEENAYYKKLNMVLEFIEDPVTLETAAEKLGNGTAAVNSFPGALHSFVHSWTPGDVNGATEALNPVLRTVRYAVSLGGDTDTIATMAGAIAGAFYGDAGLPLDLLKQLEGYDFYAEASEKILNMFTAANA